LRRERTAPNRTGRPFTGDAQATSCIRAARSGFASQPTATRRDDGLKLSGAYIHRRCALRASAEQAHAAGDRRLLQLSRSRTCCMKSVEVVRRAGKIGFDAYLNHLKRAEISPARRLICSVTVPTYKAGQWSDR